MAHHSLIQGDRRNAILGTLICIILAILFTGLQGYEYMTSTFSMADSVFGSVFFASTGLHGLICVLGKRYNLAKIIKFWGHPKAYSTKLFSKENSG